MIAGIDVQPICVAARKSLTSNNLVGAIVLLMNDNWLEQPMGLQRFGEACYLRRCKDPAGLVRISMNRR